MNNLYRPENHNAFLIQHNRVPIDYKHMLASALAVSMSIVTLLAWMVGLS